MRSKNRLIRDRDFIPVPGLSFEACPVLHSEGDLSGSGAVLRVEYGYQALFCVR